MFTLDAVRRIPSVDTELADIQRAPHDRDVAPLIPDGHDADQGAGPSSDDGDRRRAQDSGDAAEIRRRLAQDLHEADTAILSGRIEDAHRALIHAQDMVFERHLALRSANSRRPERRSTDLCLHLTNRLIDANRFKDRAIIAECRSLLDLLAETCSGRTAPGPTPT